MQLWKRITDLTITKRLGMAVGAVITINRGTSGESDVSISELSKLDGVTAGTVTASKAVVVDANKHVDTLAISDSGLKLGVSGSETAVDATGAEINAACDVSARVVLAGVSATVLAVTAALHSGRIVAVNSTVPIAITLPASSGGGAIYRFVMTAAATATGHTLGVANTVDVMAGVTIIAQTDTAQVNGFLTTATDNTITLNGTTKAGKVGDEITITDIKSGVWSVRIAGGASGTVATPFSHT